MFLKLFLHLHLTSSTLSLLNPSVGFVITGTTALITSIAILITNEYISKIRLRYTKLRDRISVTSFLYERTLKYSMIDKKINAKEANELKKIYNQVLGNFLT